MCIVMPQALLMIRVPDNSATTQS